MAISPMEGPLGIQPATPDGGGQRGKRLVGRVVRRVGNSLHETSESGDAIMLSEEARAMAEALDTREGEEG